MCFPFSGREDLLRLHHQMDPNPMGSKTLWLNNPKVGIRKHMHVLQTFYKRKGVMELTEECDQKVVILLFYILQRYSDVYSSLPHKTDAS